MWIEDEAWKEYKMKKKEQEQMEERIRELKLEVRDLALDLQDCMQREQRRVKR
jgi:hypothetical protein